MGTICISTPWMKTLRFKAVKELDQGHIAREKLRQYSNPEFDSSSSKHRLCCPLGVTPDGSGDALLVFNVFVWFLPGDRLPNTLSFGFYANVAPLANLNTVSIFSCFLLNTGRLVFVLMNIICRFPFSASGLTRKLGVTHNFL